MDVNTSTVRLLRVLRPLRLIRRVPGMTVIIEFFFKSMSDMANVLGVVIFFQIIFAVVAMQLFMTVDFPHPEFSFNSFGASMMHLFVMATGEVWSESMFHAMDATEPGRPSERHDSSSASAFFIAWVYIGQFVLMNFFIATVVNNFCKIKDEHDTEGGGGGALETPEQRQWQLVTVAMRDHKRAMPKPPPPLPELRVRQYFYYLVESKEFSFLTTAVVLFNICVMASHYYGEENDPQTYHWYTVLMTLCTRFYYLEFVLKIIGLGIHSYFDDGWNKFDFSLIVAALLEEFAAELVEEYLPLPPMLLRVMRIARVLRAVRLLRNFEKLRNVIITLLLSFPSFLNVGFFLALVIFVYAVVGVELFTFVGEGQQLKGSRTFQSVAHASELLLQCITSDGWAMVMLDARNAPERGKCDPTLEPTDCGSPVAYAYFVSYILIAMLVLRNLIVAIILQNFSALGDINPTVASKTDIEVFDDAWHRIDIDGSGHIMAEHLVELLLSLPKPLRPLGTKTRGSRTCACACMQCACSAHADDLCMCMQCAC